MSEGRLNVSNKLSKASTAISVADGKETFNRKSKNSKEKTPNERHNKTTQVYRTDKTSRLESFYFRQYSETGTDIALKVACMTCAKEIKQFSYNEANDNYNKAGFNTSETLSLFLYFWCTLRCGSICSCHCFKS